MMNPYSPFGIVLIAALVLVAALGLAALGRKARARARARRRVVERPNSHYTSQLVKNTETRHRWHDIDLEAIHEINREEVVRLLAKVEAAGVDSLRPTERVFLDQFAAITPEPPTAEPRERTGSLPPDLRHRPA